ncbi:hypothetical protein [Evansella cellulosilytica]|uniref:Uncharacterized protein n=1 Tax=Evansella cellulosilytica (strain ATCC 21833 / DSM 2522 / FERM P-1141 / JCM 9156 / N-4) TaxID=649639 RepID=E6TUP8_EVAC2|nr:hypothetical protein [Evansella cellulosilytica]ADU30938.1 hypothetical protein Bcell_2683 [Evansella cellulosilytica DSM 2522]
MKIPKKITVLVIAIILFISTYFSLTYAADSDQTTGKVENNELVDNLIEDNIDPNEEIVSSYLHAIFVEEDIHIGSTKSDVESTFGIADDEGMYEGGHFLDYGKRTYFVNPETSNVNAIAITAEQVDDEKWELVEEALKKDLKLEGMNMMEGLWMEIYDWKNYDIMIEREEEEAAPFYIWLTEDSLFTQ